MKRLRKYKGNLNILRTSVSLSTTLINHSTMPTDDNFYAKFNSNKFIYTLKETVRYFEFSLESYKHGAEIKHGAKKEENK